MRHRPEIDGLRALAVAPVILFHAGFAPFAGGYVGVDVFFVVSGYLITTIILDDLKAGRFSLLDFYERRARRILPALIVVTLCCLPFAWLWLAPGNMRDFAQSVVGVASFSSNILFTIESGYFDQASELKPLLHTWSLAVEEQFYVLFPLVLLLVWRVRASAIVWAIALAAAASFASAQWGAAHAPAAAFFLLPTRAWELLLGALCALRLAQSKPTPSRFVAEGASLLGVAMILFAVFTFDAQTPVPGAPALIPTIGAALIILFARDGTMSAKLLSTRALVGVGLISYSAYLWHQPLFAFARLRLLDAPSGLVMGVLAAAALGLAVVSYFMVEQPFRRRGFLSRRAIFALSLLALGALGAFGVAGHMTNGFAARDPKLALDQNWRDAHPCHFDFERRAADAATRDAIRACLGPDPTRGVVLMGDSHAGALAKPLRAALAEAGRPMAALTLNGCLPIPGTTRTVPQPNCGAFTASAWDAIRESGATLILSSRWRLNLIGSRYDNGEGGVEPGEDVRTIVAGAPDADVFAFAGDALRDLAATNRILLIGQIPEAGWPVPQRIRTLRTTQPAAGPLTTSAAVFQTRNAPIARWLSTLNVEAVAVDGLVCDAVGGRCLNEKDGVPLYRDDNHPSPLYARWIAEAVAARLSGDR